MPLSLRDSRTGQITPLTGRPDRPVSIYVCGPTVYAPAHVGHARTYLYFDVVRRHLTESGLPVRFVMNITDVEDKITARARELRVSWRSLARREERHFLADLAALHILPPNAIPRSSEYVTEIIEVARELEQRGR